MKKLLIPIILLLASCSSVKFVDVNLLSCRSIQNTYYPKDLNVKEQFLGSPTCNETYQHVRIRKDLIKAYFPSYSVSLDNIDGRLEISEFNVEHCNLSVSDSITGSNTDISQTCSEIDSQMK